MNWSKDKSIVLSQFCVCAFGLLLAVLDVFGYWLVGFFIQLRNMNWQLGAVILAAVYVCSIFAWMVLWRLWKLLGNIKAARVFIPGEYRPYAHRQLVLRRSGSGMPPGKSGIPALFHLRHGLGLYGPDSPYSEKCLPAGPDDEGRAGLYGVRAGLWKYL